MPHLSWQDILVFLSFNACILGLLILTSQKPGQQTDLEETDKMLFLMSFTYWAVYCTAYSIQKIVPGDWEVFLLSMKLTTVITYFLTFTCVLSLPLHKMASRRVEQ